LIYFIYFFIYFIYSNVLLKIIVLVKLLFMIDKAWDRCDELQKLYYRGL